MDASPRAISPLRQRMIDDMRMCKLSPKTQLQYLRAVQKLTGFVGRSPDTVTVEDLRRYQLHLVDHGTSPVSINAAITGLKFFFEVTLDRRDLISKMRPVRVPYKLPVVLSREEAARLIAAAGNLKHQTALSVAYGTGLRASEVTSLKVGDVDSQRMTLRVEQGKGRKDRYVMLSPELLDLLRQWWKVRKSRYFESTPLQERLLFPGRSPRKPMSTRQLNRLFHEAACAARIKNGVTLHTLRHSFATHLLEGKTDIRFIQALLGHHKLYTTAHYTRVATGTIASIASPLDQLSKTRKADKRRRDALPT